MTQRQTRACLIWAIAAVAVSQPVFAQTLGQGAADDGISAWRVIFALLLCLALGIFAMLVLRARLGGRALPSFLALGSGRRLKVVESVRLAGPVELNIVSCDGQDLLVASGAQGARVLRELGPSPVSPPKA